MTTTSYSTLVCSTVMEVCLHQFLPLPDALCWTLNSISLFVGRGVVDWVVSHFDYNLKEAYTSSDLTTVEQCLEYAFLYTDIQTKQNDLCVDGSTGAVVFMQCNDEGKRVLYAANVGDTRIVSCRNGVATRLSYVWHEQPPDSSRTTRASMRTKSSESTPPEALCRRDVSPAS